MNEVSSRPVFPLGFVVAYSPGGDHSGWDEMDSHSTFNVHCPDS